MPSPGRKPQAETVTKKRQAAFDWIEVEDKPFRGKIPVSVPAKRRIRDDRGNMRPVAWEPMARAWWRTISSMPHCRIWTKSDWEFALMTMVVADNVARGGQGAAGELRQREAIMGVTFDSRRDLRIRYVERLPETKIAIVPSTVTSIDERRRRSTGADSAS